MAVHVVNEAKRCLNCKKPMCRQGCPINTPIPQMIQAFLSNDINGAGAMLFENNPLSIVCSLVCDHEKQCEGHCVLGRKGSPVQISSIENYISDSYFDRMVIEREKPNGMKAAIIGGGPAGITIAVELARKGYGVTIFDTKEKIGGVLQYGIPEFRLPKSILKRYQKKLKEIGIHFSHDGLDRLAKAMRHYFFSRKAADEAARRAAGLPYRPMEAWDYADGWVLKGDFSKFFYTLLHAVCYEKAKKALAVIEDDELRDFVEWLLSQVIDSTPDPGIPIGNQSSQLLALLYLDDFDHWLRDDLGLVYGRYMDDFYIISSDKLLLRRILKEIEEYIKPLGLRLNKKTQIFPLKNGIDFLGFHTYLTSTGKVVRKVRAKSIDNMKRKIRKYRGLVDSGRMTLEGVVQSYASWCGHISHGNTYHLRQSMDSYFFGYFPELKPNPKGDNTHGPKTEQPRKQSEG